MQFLLVSSLVLSFIVPFFFIICKTKCNGPVATMIKSFSSFCFVLLSILLYYHAENTTLFGLIIILGLLFGLFGDVFLDLQNPNIKKDSPFLFGGIASFSLEHILNLSAVSVHLGDGFHIYYLFLSILFGVVFAIAIGYVEKSVLKYDFGKSFPVVLMYSVILAASFAYYLILTIINPAYFILLIAMTLFLISDCVLSVMYFDGKNDNHYLLIVNILTYYFAQILFALFLFFH